MAYSPHTPRTPRTPRAMASSSAPPTPHVGYTVPERTHVHNHHYAGILMHHDSSNSDSSMGYISPTHRTLGTSYGTMQTEVSGGCPQASRHLVVEIPSLDDTSLHSQIVLRKSVAWIWVIINIVVFGLSAFCLLQPNWVTNDSTQASVGLFNYCEEGASLSTELEKCRYYSADANSKITLHSLSWQIAAVVYTISCSIFGISALVTTLCLCISDISLVNKLCLLAGLHQLISGILLLTSLITLPVGFDAPEIKQMCGESSEIYNTGSCHVGWSFIIPSACCMLSFTLPVLSHYVTYMPKYQNLNTL